MQGLLFSPAEVRKGPCHEPGAEVFKRRSGAVEQFQYQPVSHRNQGSGKGIGRQDQILQDRMRYFTLHIGPYGFQGDVMEIHRP